MGFRRQVQGADLHGPSQDRPGQRRDGRLRLRGHRPRDRRRVHLHHGQGRADHPGDPDQGSLRQPDARHGADPEAHRAAVLRLCDQPGAAQGRQGALGLGRDQAQLHRRHSPGRRGQGPAVVQGARALHDAHLQRPHRGREGHPRGAVLRLQLLPLLPAGGRLAMGSEEGRRLCQALHPGPEFQQRRLERGDAVPDPRGRPRAGGSALPDPGRPIWLHRLLRPQPAVRRKPGGEPAHPGDQLLRPLRLRDGPDEELFRGAEPQPAGVLLRAAGQDGGGGRRLPDRGGQQLRRDALGADHRGCSEPGGRRHRRSGGPRGQGLR